MQTKNITKLKKPRKPVPKAFIIYLARDMTNGMVYIGQTNHPLNYRIAKHKSDKSGMYFSQAFQKRPEAFQWFIIDTAETRDELNIKEVRWIKEHNSLYPNGYNLTLGGEGTNGYRMPLESRKHLSEIVYKRYQQSRPPEVRERDKYLAWERWAEDRRELYEQAIALQYSARHKRKCTCNNIQCPICRQAIRSRMARLQGKGEYLRKGRARKLSDSQVVEIRTLYASGEYTYTALSKMFKVSRSAIGVLITGDTFKTLPLAKDAPLSFRCRMEKWLTDAGFRICSRCRLWVTPVKGDSYCRPCNNAEQRRRHAAKRKLTKTSAGPAHVIGSGVK